jgi:endonuclease VIII
LFLENIHPRTPLTNLTDQSIELLLKRAASLMQTNLRPARFGQREFGNGLSLPWVYGRAGRPCRRCKSPIDSERLGTKPRLVYWCSCCQPFVAPNLRSTTDL